MRAAERLSQHTLQLPPLVIGDHVRIQNQVGPFPNKWDKTGVVVEVRNSTSRPYVIRVDGSGRVTLRNRKFLRQYEPVVPRHPVAMSPGQLSTPTTYPARPTLNDRKGPESPSSPQMDDSPIPPATPAESPGQSMDDIIPPAPEEAAPSPKNAAPTARSESLPRALRGLLPFNAPGLRESAEANPTPRRTRQSSHVTPSP